MRKIRFPIVLLLSYLFSCNSVSLYAQAISTEGRDFWVGFMNNWLQDPGNPIILEIYLSSKDTTHATVDMPLIETWGPFEADIFPDRATKITVPTSLAMAVGSGSVQDIGIHILSDDDISVYAMNKRQWSADITVILPSISLGRNYLATAHWEPGNRNGGANSQSEILVLSIADSSEIVIDPSVNIQNGNPAHQSFSIILNRGQVYQIQAYGDLTGTHIYSAENSGSLCNNFAVFAGNRYTKVGQCDHPDGHDHLYAQMFPTNTWGKSFITVPLESRSGGDYYKILASKDSTEVIVNNQTFILNEAEVILLTLVDVSSIEASKPISVVQFSRSQACDNSTSDPFMIVVSPKEQLLDQVTFNAPPGNNLNFYFMNVVAKTLDLNNIFLDNIPVVNYFKTVPFDNSFSYAQIPIFEGNHTLKSSQGFIAYVYGFGSNESFGFATGASLQNLLVDIDLSDLQGNPFNGNEICRFDKVLFTAETQDVFTDFFWDFGDGVTALSDSTEITHEYDKAGVYLVRLIASIGNTSCALGGSETSFELVRVVKPEIEILGPKSVCPNTIDVLYRTDGESGNQYQWWAEGGVISSELDLDSVHVDWGETNSMALLRVFTIDERGCFGDTVDHPVKINIQLEPEAPFGPDSLCSSDITNLSYYAYETNGSEYTWEIRNGAISEGQGTSDIELSWGSYGRGSLWFTQTSSIDSVCAGVSDTLNAFIERNPPDLALLQLSSDSLNIGEILYASVKADTIYQTANWQIPGILMKDSVSIDTSIQWQFNCQGNYNLEVMVFDTLGLCQAKTTVSRPVFVRAPDMEILNVTHSLSQEKTLQVNWKYENMSDFPKPITLSRKEYLPHNGSWVELGLLTSDQFSITDMELPTKEESFAYKMTTNKDCQETLEVLPHNSILLQGDLAENFDLSWNSYNNWLFGVRNYEVWEKIDDQVYELVYSGQDLKYTYVYKSEGFDICFRIRAEEKDGNAGESWSNEICEGFFPELTPYNVFSPNNDQWNQYFIIDGIELYPNSILTIVNRYGRTVYESTGYQNNWDGSSSSGEHLGSGVYFWTLQLNEPRVDVEYLKGEISVLY